MFLAMLFAVLLSVHCMGLPARLERFRATSTSVEIGRHLTTTAGDFVKDRNFQPRTKHRQHMKRVQGVDSFNQHKASLESVTVIRKTTSSTEGKVVKRDAVKAYDYDSLTNTQADSYDDYSEYNWEVEDVCIFLYFSFDK